MKLTRQSRRAMALFAAALMLVPLNPAMLDAGHIGFRGGFRGGFGHGGFGRGFHGGGFHGGFGGFHRGFGGFGGFNRGFHRSGFRGFSGFGSSRFNSLAFRGRGFGFGFGFNRGFARGRGFRSFNRGFNRGFVRVGRGFSRGGFHRGFASTGPVLITNPHVVGRPVLSDPVLASRVVAGDGWGLLEQNEPVLASQAFQRQIAKDKSAGVPKVGFALAAADAGDLDKGVWAMRRAFQADAERVGDMMMEDSLRPLVARVTAKYEDLANEEGIDRDSQFMMAALYQLQGDPEMASMAMEYVVGEDKGAGDEPGAASLSALIKQEMAAMPMASGPGWDLLVEDQPLEARDAFVNVIAEDPNAGEPKVGYALAAAAAGDLDRGVWAMRRAFEIDPDHTADMMISGKLRPMVAKVTEAYESAPQDADSMFMLAALYQLQDEVEDAMHAVEESMSKDKQAPGSDSLFQLVSTEVEVTKAMKAGDDYALEEIAADGSDTITLPPVPSETLVLPAASGSSTKEAGSGTKDPGSGTKDASSGTKEAGSGTKDPGSGTKAAEMPKPELDDAEVHDYALDRTRVGRPVTLVRPAPTFIRAKRGCGIY